MKKKIIILCCGLLAAAGCSSVCLGADRERDPAIRGNVLVSPTLDTRNALGNPLDGWVLYANHIPAPDYWDKLDNIYVPSLDRTVAIADYARTIYIRGSWAVFNPREDEYGWDTDAGLKMLIEGARERGMQLAFRVVVDSRDEPSTHTPAFVIEAGAKGFESRTGRRTVWSPYPDDPVFQQKFEKFVRAFAREFNDPAVTGFIDGFGLGLWGETHCMKYLDYADREMVFKWVVDLYAENFTKVPLAINYHRLIGAAESWGAPDPDSERLLDYAFSKGYILRHDAFGMSDYYQDWERKLATKWKFTRPIIMEGGWVNNHHDITLDPRGYKTPADVRKGEFEDAEEAHANMMDFRTMETRYWFTDAFDLVERFMAEGGYKLWPDRLSLPKSVRRGASATISHRWKNMGWGYFPNNIPQWNYKYKVAFALLDASDTAVKVFIDTQAEPSEWLKDKSAQYDFITKVDVPAGTYTWAVAIVDTQKSNQPAIKLAVSDAKSADGWVKLRDVQVK